jgi:uncharacterized protein YeaO (DUF488 family)
MIILKRIYQPYSKSDGFRVLVDRLWPRGMSKEKAKINQWLKDIGPSNELRKWFGHEPEKWAEFKRKYKKELTGKKDLLKELKDLHKKHKKLTLLYGARDEKHNEAVVIAEMIEK